jgi:uroporphyrinogen-III synthase
VKALVTRPAEDAASLAAALHARGIEALTEPMLTIRLAEDGAARLSPLLPGVQALLFTSANGVRAFVAAAVASGRRGDGEPEAEPLSVPVFTLPVFTLPVFTLPVFTVGNATAEAARDAGFARVSSAGGTVDDLARLVIDSTRPQDGALLHAAASAVAGDLAGQLGAAGFEVRRAILYDAVPAAALRHPIRHALHAGAVDVAFFFSPRTAATFVRLAEDADLRAACGRVTALALSPAVATALAALPWRTVVAAEAPREDALLAALDDIL